MSRQAARRVVSGHLHPGLRRPQRLLQQRSDADGLDQVHHRPGGLQRPQHGRNELQLRLSAEQLLLRLQLAQEPDLVLLLEQHQHLHRNLQHLRVRKAFIDYFFITRLGKGKENSQKLSTKTPQRVKIGTIKLEFKKSFSIFSFQSIDYIERKLCQ